MKHLIMLFDGTWNSAATGHYDDITNVFRLNLAISRHDKDNNPQIVFYIPGPGTRGVVDEQLGGAFGQGIDQIVREAYVNLASNYNSGDIIYLFGFSRGGIAARALSALISSSGLLQPKNLHLLPIAWKRFVNINQGKEFHAGLKDLTNYVHSDVKIKFAGLFDSVIGRDPSFKSHFSDLTFSNQQISKIIEVGVQILSIDDDRKIFTPLLWDGDKLADQYVEQVWMPGVHGDIGGVGQPHFLGVASFLYMIERIHMHTPLRINGSVIEEFITTLKNFNQIAISNERASAFWKLFVKASRSSPGGGVNQLVHPLAKLLHRRNIIIRESMNVYNDTHLDTFLAMNVSEDAMSNYVLRHAEEVLLKMH